MRRLLSLLLLATVGMPFWAPLLALGQRTTSTVPVCCRRDGKHHCAMTGMAADKPAAEAEAPSARWNAPFERCPYCPGAISAACHHELGSAEETATVFAPAFAQPLGLVQTEARRRLARERSRHKRGPPHTISL